MAKIIALHSRQPLTVNLARVFPDDDCLILTDGDPTAVLREDVDGQPPTVDAMPRAQWANALRAWPGAQLVTNDEYCVRTCANMRAALNLPPRHPAAVERYLDKVAMKQCLSQRGVRVPRYHALEPVVSDDVHQIRTLLTRIGLPAVAKPRREANSHGVRVLHTHDELHTWLAAHRGERGWQIEQYVSGTGYHVNALVRNGRLEPVQVGRYFGPLLDLSTGRRLGSVSVPSDDPITMRLHGLNAAVVDALGGEGDFVIHTELILPHDGEPVVLEVAARAPGAEVPQMAKLHSRIELAEANLRMQAGLNVSAPRPTGTHAAWLWVPVMPGERYRAAPHLKSSHKVQIRRAGRDGHTEKSGVVGLSAVLWNDDPVALTEDIDTALTTAWFAR